MGGSTASLWFFSRYVDTVRNVVKSQLPAPYLDTLNFLMGQVRSSRHFQQKIGPSYYAVVIKDGQERRMAMVPGWAIIDLSKKRQYVFRHTPYFELYERFLEKNYR